MAYQIRSQWQTGLYTDPLTGNRYTKRRTVGTYYQRSTRPVNEWYEYMDIIGGPKGDITGPGQAGDAPPDMEDILTELDDPSSIGEDPDEFMYPVSGDLAGALFRAYTDYLDLVEMYNGEMLRKIREYHEGMLLHYLRGSKQEIIDKRLEEIQDDIMAEFEADRIVRPTFEEWKTMSEEGTLFDPRTTVTHPESESVINLNKLHVLQKRLDTMGGVLEKGLRLANDLYLPQLFTLQLFKDSNIFQNKFLDPNTGKWKNIKDPEYYPAMNIIRNVSRETAQGIERQVNYAGGGGYKDINYKSAFEKLQDTALKQGKLSNPWKLRLPDTIPIKERWRRLYATLSAYLKGK